VGQSVKILNINFPTWELLASECLKNRKRFELLGFDLEIPSHRAFWDKAKRTGTFHCGLEIGVKACFIPAT
jgi:hypothetical protein